MSIKETKLINKVFQEISRTKWLHWKILINIQKRNITVSTLTFPRKGREKTFCNSFLSGQNPNQTKTLQRKINRTMSLTNLDVKNPLHNISKSNPTIYKRIIYHDKEGYILVIQA